MNKYFNYRNWNAKICCMLVLKEINFFINYINYCNFSSHNAAPLYPISPWRCLLSIMLPLYMAIRGLRKKSLNHSGAVSGNFLNMFLELILRCTINGFLISLSGQTTFPVACMHCILAAIFAYYVVLSCFVFFSMKCISKKQLKWKGKLETRKKQATKWFFNLNTLKTSVMFVW